MCVDQTYFMGKVLSDFSLWINPLFRVSFILSYYKDPEKTAEAIDSEGWHHTGDVGMWLPNGTLRIIDRRKHIFKLSQGEYIVPEKIENIYTLSQYVNQVYVYGESLKVGGKRSKYNNDLYIPATKAFLTISIKLLIPKRNVFEQFFKAKVIFNIKYS